MLIRNLWLDLLQKSNRTFNNSANHVVNMLFYNYIILSLCCIAVENRELVDLDKSRAGITNAIGAWFW